MRVILQLNDMPCHKVIRGVFVRLGIDTRTGGGHLQKIQKQRAIKNGVQYIHRRSIM